MASLALSVYLPPEGNDPLRGQLTWVQFHYSDLNTIITGSFTTQPCILYQHSRLQSANITSPYNFSHKHTNVIRHRLQSNVKVDILSTDYGVIHTQTLGAWELIMKTSTVMYYL